MGRKYSEGKDYKVIAFVTACFSKDDQQDLIKKVTEKSFEQNCRVIFFSTLTNFYMEDLDAGEKRIFDTVAVEKFDAIVLMAETFKEEGVHKKLVQRAAAAGVPVIAVDHYVEGCINVSFDYREAFRKIVKHMVEFHGYRKINFMAGMPNNSFSDERLEVFRQVLEENGREFDPKNVYYGYFWENPTIEAMKKMLENSTELPEAIICANDTMALTVCDYLKQRGYRVPEDVAVSGFDGLEAGKYHQPQLLTSVYNVEAFAEALFRRINDGGLVAEEKEWRVSAYHEIQVGGSCGCQGLPGEDAAAKIIQLKSDMYEQMEYQTNLGRMVANYGEGEGMDIIQKVIPHQLRYMHYYDFWFCSEQRLLIADYPFYAGSSRLHEAASGMINAIHYERQLENVAINYAERMEADGLIPELNNYLEENHPLLVVSVPTQEDPNAYAVISMDTDRFWYTAYSSFIFHLRFLLDMQRSKKMLMQVYRTDALTGVLNRNGFYAMMKQVMEYSSVKELTVISLDMCEFKQINDTYGHAEGDEALKAVGEIIRESISPREIAARTGRDEFLIILFRGNQKERAKEIIASMNEKAEKFNGKNSKRYRLIFSIGVYSELMGEHSLDYFLREADKRMYQNKKEQKLGR
ncbi:MAG: GGDEF domain-containing protein [Lachnospiraceae bacterium]|nr:GGDEF domain-containing protein [Lachnospiraceae bacterium]